MNAKRMEVMLADLSDSLDRHIETAKDSYHFVLPCNNGEGKLTLRLYSKGGSAELEILAFAQSGNINFAVKVDGEKVDDRYEVLTIAPLTLSRGWRTLEISGKGISTAKIRITGSISGVNIL